MDNWTLTSLVVFIFIKLFYSLRDDFLIEIYLLEIFNFCPINKVVHYGRELP